LVGATGGVDTPCVTVIVVPATMMVPERDVPVVLAATLKLVMPLPVPLVPEDSVIQLALLIAFQLHVPAVVIVTLAFPPPLPMDCEVGETVNVQLPPVCVTVTVFPAMVNVPVRVLVVGFVEIKYVALPLPLLVAPAVTAIHDTLLAAVQLQPLATVTVVVFDPP
jgi:hypothetical protein